MSELAREVEARYTEEEARIQARLRQISSSLGEDRSQEDDEARRSELSQHKKAIQRNSNLVKMTTKEDGSLDFSFKGLTCLEGLVGEKPRKSCRKSSSGKYHASNLRLNNNSIKQLDGISSLLSEVVEDPLRLRWLDLSFNGLVTLPPELAKLSSLKILYLHGNHLVDLQELLVPLRQLEGLYSLTLHGNPVEERKNYRLRVVSALPQLKTLDFSNITHAEKDKIKVKHNNAKMLKSPARSRATSPRTVCRK